MYLWCAAIVYYAILCAVFFAAPPAAFVYVLSFFLYWRFKNAKPQTKSLSEPAIIAHRGCGEDYPENTLGAFDKADHDDVDGIEFDLEFTKDGVPVILHDDTIDRTTNGRGRVKDYMYSELGKFNAAANHPKRKDFPFEKIPTLEETVKFCLDAEVKMFIDVKGGSFLAVDALEKMFEKYPKMIKEAVVCSFNPIVPYLIRRHNPEIVAGLTHRNWYLSREMDGTPRFSSAIKRGLMSVADMLLEFCVYSWLPSFIGISAFLICRQDVNERVVREFHERNINVIVWTVNHPAEKNYIKEVLKCSYMTDSTRNEKS